MSAKIKTNGDKTIKHDRIKAKLGLSDKKNHSVFYLEGGTFITPEIELDDFTETMRTIELICRRSIKNKLFQNSFLDTTFLMNFEICSCRMKQGKNSYLSFQYHFRQKNNSKQNILTIKQLYGDFFVDLLNDLEFNLKQHKMTLTQKRNNN